jgi:WhiB family transcriptional regulator, redox-sensing transcriptional regulator
MSVESHFLDESWQLDAACRGAESHLFFAPNHFERKEDKESREARAKEICSTCSVIGPCRDYALAIREPHGIWGGLTEVERKAILVRDGLI